MRQVQKIMGMPVSIDVPDAGDQLVFDEIFAYVHSVDEKFSTYREDSEVSRFNNRQLAKEALSPDVAYVYQQCAKYTKLTGGYFSACYNEAFDPSGYVKAWAMKHVASIIESHGYTTYLVNIAGDMIASGSNRPWKIAIQDPLQKDSLLGVVTLHNQSIATSGSYERGEHIINPLTKSADSDLISASIYGIDIIMTDVFATTCIAMGSKKALTFLAAYPTYAALLIKKDGIVLCVNYFQLTKMKIVQ